MSKILVEFDEKEIKAMDIELSQTRMRMLRIPENIILEYVKENLMVGEVFSKEKIQDWIESNE